jgi:NRPS condensation-like uncharacterized protein
VLGSERSQWRKLDNAALAFPAATGKKDTRVFRFYCKLKETVDGKLLQTALDQTLEQYPLFQMVLRKGVFWFYLEHRELKPSVREEDRPPCSKLYIPDQKSLLFDVSYYKDRINFEVFHALTDGTGAMAFIKELVSRYLKAAHPEAELPELSQTDDITGSDQEEDSFSQYYSKEEPRNTEKTKPAYQLHGERLEQDEMHILETVLSVKEILAKAREYGVSITVLLAAMMLCAIHEEIPKRLSKKPVSLMVPVNLRNYFPSQSMTNFFGWIEVGYQFRDNTAFEDVLYHVKGLFEKELVKERIGMRMNELVRLEKNPLLRAVPLEIKNVVLQAGTTLGGKSITAIYSNVGVIRMPKAYDAYIDRFGLFTSTDKMQLCSCSYGDQLVLGFTSKIRSTNIQRNFLRMLRQEGISYTEEKNDFPGYVEEPKRTAKRILQAFTFLSIAAAVICCMVNYLISNRISWAGYAAAGCFCTWLTVAVAYKKRRNPLKSVMWQLFILSAIGILWDLFTGWRGWSVDFLLPAACLLTLCAMLVISKVRHLEPSEYLFYLIQACAFGWIPLILFWTKVVTFKYLSIICAGLCFLFFAGLLIFRRKEVMQELHKKFRM